MFPLKKKKKKENKKKAQQTPRNTFIRGTPIMPIKNQQQKTQGKIDPHKYVYQKKKTQ